MAKVQRPSQAELERIWNLRWRARTDLLWLCHNVLNYRLVDANYHGPMIQHLQQFPRPTLEVARESDKILPDGLFQYTPWVDPYTLEGSRRRVILDTRGYFKTSINTIAHTIQWLLNFPHIGIAIFFSTDAKAQHTIKNEIKQHFQTNQRLRSLFPEYCPRIRINDWGDAESFILPNRLDVLSRLRLPARKEPSVLAQSIDKGQAGYHFDVIKCSDIVEENNVVTVTQREQVKKRFGLIHNLLVRRPDSTDGWVDVEGTFYHPDDLHVNLIDQWQNEETLGDPHSWSIFIRGCFKRDAGDQPLRHTPAELKLPFLLDAEKKRVPSWPAMDTLEKLETKEKDPQEGGFTFACQRALDINADKSSARPFNGTLTWIARDAFKSVPVAYRLTTVDLADTDGPKSHPSVITTCAYDRAGRCYVESIQRGHWNPDETIRRLLATHLRYRPTKMVIEDYAYTHGLRPSIHRACVFTEDPETRQPGVWPNFDFRPAIRTKSKHQRIIDALQPPFSSGELRFVEPFDCSIDKVTNEEEARLFRATKAALEAEFQGVTNFSTGASDDIIDTLATQYLCREWFGMEGLRGGAEGQAIEAQARLAAEQIKKARHDMIFGEQTARFDPFRSQTGW